MLIRIVIALAFVACITSCSKERLFSPQIDADKFVAETPESFKQEIQKIKINSERELPFVTKNGNRVYVYEDSFAPLKNGTSVKFPIDLEVTELLSIKDIILHEKPTVSNGRLLTTDGQIKVQAFKNGEELLLDSSWDLQIDMRGLSRGNGDPEMQLFLGEETGEGFNWTVDSTDCGPVSLNGCDNIFISDEREEDWGKYIMFPSSLGWINIDKFANYDDVTTVYFSSGTDLKKVRKFLFVPELTSVLQVYGNQIDGVPLGMKAIVIAYTFTEEEDVFSYFEEITVQQGHKIEIKLSPSSKEDFLKRLSEL